MSESLKAILDKKLNDELCKEVTVVDMKKNSKFSYLVFNPEDDE